MQTIHEQTWEVDASKMPPRVRMGPKGMAPGGTWPIVTVQGEDPADRDVALRFIAAAPDMARAGMLLYARVAEAAQALPSARTAEALAEMDTLVAVPSSIIREVFAAMRRAGVLP